MAHACFCLRVFGFSPTNGTKRAERPQNQNRFHSSSKGKTRWVVTSIAFLYRRLHVSSVCLETPDNISALLSPHFYCERLQIHLPNNALIHDLQPLGRHFAHMASEVPLDIENKAEMLWIACSRFILMPFISQHFWLMETNITCLWRTGTFAGRPTTRRTTFPCPSPIKSARFRWLIQVGTMHFTYNKQTFII